MTAQHQVLDVTGLAVCPFCGFTEHLSFRSTGSYTPDMPSRPYRVICTYLDHDTVEGPVGYGKHGARLEWNRRAPPPPSEVRETTQGSEAGGLVKRLIWVARMKDDHDEDPNTAMLLREAATRISTQKKALAEMREARDLALAMADAYKVLLYSDEVFVGTHWEGDFRDPATKSWPTLCAHFPSYGADAEEIPPDHILPLAQLVRENGSDAILAWSCFHRGVDDVVKGHLTEKARQILKALKGGHA